MSWLVKLVACISTLVGLFCTTWCWWSSCVFSHDYWRMTTCNTPMMNRSAILRAWSTRSWRSSLLLIGSTHCSLLLLRTQRRIKDLLRLELFKMLLNKLLLLSRVHTRIRYWGWGFSMIETIWCLSCRSVRLLLLFNIALVFWCRAFRSGVLNHRTWLRDFPTFLNVLLLLSIDNESRILVYSGQLIVIVIPIKKWLDGISSQHKDILLKLLIILIFPIFIYVLLIKIVFFRRNIRGLDLLIPEILPWEILIPRMILDLTWSIYSKSIHWFSLNHLSWIKK